MSSIGLGYSRQELLNLHRLHYGFVPESVNSYVDVTVLPCGGTVSRDYSKHPSIHDRCPGPSLIMTLSAH
jgi:hypothetical protein